MEPRSRAAARRNDLDADQRQPTIRRRGRTRTTNPKPCRRSSGNAIHTSFNHRGTITASPVLRPPAESAGPATRHGAVGCDLGALGRRG